MKGPNHFCSICRQEFSRKSNATRHNDRLHKSQGEIIPLRRFLYDKLSGKYRPGVLSSIDQQNDDEVLTEALVRMEKEFRACEEELSNLPNLEKANIIADIVTRSLRTEDPKKSMQSYLNGIRRNNLRLRAIQYVASALNLTPQAAKVILINNIKQGLRESITK